MFFHTHGYEKCEYAHIKVQTYGTKVTMYLLENI